MQISVRALFMDALRTFAGAVRPLALLILWPAAAFLASRLASGTVQLQAAPVGGATTWPFTVIGWLALLWLALRITRRHLAENSLAPVKGEAAAYGAYLLYCLAVWAIMMAWVLPWFWLVGSHAVTHRETLIVTGAAVALLSFYVQVRVSIAMPAVMLGQRPHLLRSIWPFGRPLALRVFAGLLVILAAGRAIDSMLYGAVAAALYPAGYFIFLLVSGVIEIAVFAFAALVFANAYMALLAAWREREGPPANA